VHQVGSIYRILDFSICVLPLTVPTKHGLCTSISLTYSPPPSMLHISSSCDHDHRRISCVCIKVENYSRFCLQNSYCLDGICLFVSGCIFQTLKVIIRPFQKHEIGNGFLQHESAFCDWDRSLTWYILLNEFIIICN